MNESGNIHVDPTRHPRTAVKQTTLAENNLKYKNITIKINKVSVNKFIFKHLKFISSLSVKQSVKKSRLSKMSKHSKIFNKYFKLTILKMKILIVGKYSRYISGLYSNGVSNSFIPFYSV